MDGTERKPAASAPIGIDEPAPEQGENGFSTGRRRRFWFAGKLREDANLAILRADVEIATPAPAEYGKFEHNGPPAPSRPRRVFGLRAGRRRNIENGPPVRRRRQSGRQPT